MDELLTWWVTYQLHTYDGVYVIEGRKVKAPTIGEAIVETDAVLDMAMCRHNWSDYNITAVTVIPELH